MKTIRIGIIEFDIKECKSLSKKNFYKIHEATCKRFNVDIDFAYEKLSGKKASPKKD